VNQSQVFVCESFAALIYMNYIFSGPF
jgi:hypothetical protein